METKLKSTKGDIGHALVKGSISSIPIIGGAAAEIFSLILEPPISQRRDKFLISLYEKLEELNETIEGFKIEELSENEIFVTALTHALPVAVKNHQVEKITALRNVVLNSVLPNAPDEDKQLMFLDLIDSFTSWHLKILILLNDPKGYANENDISIPNWQSAQLLSLIELVFPELKGKREFYTQVWNDLYNHNLINISSDSLHTIITGHGTLGSRTTGLGAEFISFIKDPSV